MTGDNDPEMIAELDRHGEAVRAAPAGDTTAQIALWRQVTGLEHWFFIARGSAGQPRPYAVAAEQGSMMCLHGSAARANEAIRALGLADSEGGAAPLFGVPMPAAIDYVASFGKARVAGVTLDHPRLGHYIPLKARLEGAAR